MQAEKGLVFSFFVRSCAIYHRESGMMAYICIVSITEWGRKMKKKMNDIRGYLIGTIWTFLSLLVPIRDFMIAMMVLFGLNLVFGIVAAVFNGEEWSWKKFGMFFVCCAVFFVTVAALFIIGHFLHSDTEALFCVKWVCIAATYLFTTNILKNLRRMLVPDTPFYKLVEYAYYALTLGFVEKFPMFKKYQEYKNNKENGNEGNQIRAAADGNA